MAKQKQLETAELLYNSAQKLGLKPSWIVPDGLFAVTINGTEKYIHYSYSSLNSHTAISLARNKHLTRLILGRHGLANIPFMRPENLTEATAFLDLHGTIIAKPISGRGSHDINIITSRVALEALKIRAYILEKYIVGTEFRYLLLNGAVIGVHRSEYGTSVEHNRHLERYSIPPSRWDPVLIASSIRIANIMDLNFTAIDYLIDSDGKHHVLEVNSTPGLKWFHAPTTGPAVDVATLFLQTLVREPLPEIAPVSSEIASHWYTQLT